MSTISRNFSLIKAFGDRGEVTKCHRDTRSCVNFSRTAFNNNKKCEKILCSVRTNNEEHFCIGFLQVSPGYNKRERSRKLYLYVCGTRCHRKIIKKNGDVKKLPQQKITFNVYIKTAYHFTESVVSNVNGKQSPKITTKTINTFLRMNRNIFKHVQHRLMLFRSQIAISVQQLIFAYSQSIPTSSAQICAHASRTHVYTSYIQVEWTNAISIIQPVARRTRLFRTNHQRCACQKRKLELVFFFGIREIFKQGR